MKISQTLGSVTDVFDTLSDEMVCVASERNGNVKLCFKKEGGVVKFPIAEIRLYNTGLYTSFEEMAGAAKNLGDEIARRWNECKDKR